MDLIVQPADGIKPLLDAINGAKKTLDLIIFRFDLKEVEKALEAAVRRGVNVSALIAHTHSGIRQAAAPARAADARTRASP